MASEVPYTKLSGKKSRCCTCRVLALSLLIVFLAVAAVGFLFVGIGGSCYFPLHASCSVSWTFNAQCIDVKNALVEQMKKWQSADNCKDGGEKCLYKIVTLHDLQVTATHETPNKHYVDELTFNFAQNGDVCELQGHSTSDTWYAILDYGTNYCNMHNLITGSKLDKDKGYSETTSNKICTQYSSANCDVY